jgi:hypothetical protein
MGMLIRIGAIQQCPDTLALVVSENQVKAWFFFAILSRHEAKGDGGGAGRAKGLRSL